MSKEVKKEELEKKNSKEKVKKDEVKKNNNKTEKKDEVKKNNNKTEKKQDTKKEDKKKVVDTKPVVKKQEKVKKPISEKVVIYSIIVAILIVAFGIFGFYFYSTSFKAVATYDGGKVTKSEFTIYYKTFQPMLSYFGYSSDIIPEQVANKAAMDEIIIKEAKKEGITIPDDRKKEIDEQFKDEEQLKQLEEQGINPNQMKELYYSDALISAYIDKKVADAKDEDVINYIKSNENDANLNSYETSHILFTTKSESGTELSDEEKANKKAKAEDTLRRAQAGEDFATLAKELSEDTGTKDNGGNYTVYKDGQTDESYANAAMTMKVGDIVLVESSYGYHIIKLNSITENGRAKSDYDRENYVNEQINKISTEKNFKVDEDELKKVVEQINGKASTSEEDTTNTTTTTDTSTTTTDTDTTNNTTGE